MNYENEGLNISPDVVAGQIHRISQEIKRITGTTLRGVFAKSEDREFWLLKLEKLNSELNAFEALAKPKKLRKGS